MKTKKYSISSSVILLVFVLLNFNNTQAQIEQQSKIVNTYIKHFKSPREVAYVHLNKSTYIKGEMLGLTAYVFDKTKSQLSTNSTNLYCTIEDSQGKRIKEDLIMLIKGVSNNAFKIDSTFTTGNYVIKAYTNWMRNFDEQNYFVSSFAVVDPDITPESVAEKSEVIQLDIQVLPESGHAIYNAQNTYGIIVKNQYGKGIPNLKAAVIQNNLDTINKFSLNRFGIAKTPLKPSKGNTYEIVVNYNGEDYNMPISDIKDQGVVMSVKAMRDKTLVSVFNNKLTDPNKTYKLVLHNGNQINSWEFKINAEDNKQEKLFDNKILYKGINIFTLFDQDNNPLLERLFFNYQGIETNTVSGINFIKKDNDSVNVNIKMPNINPNQFNNLSISILPQGSKSYRHNHNILSYTLLQPYINGFIESPKYYFANITERTKYNLDLLLSTQGWSSYKWNTILGSPKEPIYPFEQGISFNAKINNKKTNQYFINPLRNSKSFLIELDDDDTEFDAQALFPVEKDKLKIRGIGKKGKAIKPSLYFSFSPKIIPTLSIDTNNILFPNNVNTNLNTLRLSNFTLKNDVEQLDEVIVTAKKAERTKYEKLKDASSGRFIVFDSNMRRDLPDFATWIASQGFNVTQNLGRLSITNQRRNTLGLDRTSPVIFLDNTQLINFDILYNFRMDTVEYIEIDRNGFRMGMQGGFGVIRIKTKPSLILEDQADWRATFDSQVVDFPLSFSTDKKFYTPLYQYYDSNFYNEYGVVDWFPNVTAKIDGSFDISFYNPSNKPIELHIEGIVNNTNFISETKIVKP